ncbi:MAG: PilW family protein [Halieaceae bacterium]
MSDLKKLSVSHFQCGLSLIELMVALALGVVLMLGAATLFVQNKVSYLQDEELARIQESGRYAIRYVTRQLSMGGFYGGLLRASDIDNGIFDPNDPSTCFTYMFEAEKSFEHINDVTSDAGTETGAGANNDHSVCIDAADSVQVNTDILIVRRSKDSITVDQGVPSANATDKVPYIRVRDYNVEVSFENDIESGDVTSDLDLWEYYPEIIWVRDYAENAGDNLPTLCRKRLSTTTANAVAPVECLVQGVEEMHVEFGLDSDLDYTVERYEQFPTEAELTTAITARVYLLMRSPDEVVGYTNDKTYIMGSRTVTKNDSYYRRLFQSTVTLRNSEALGI